MPTTACLAVSSAGHSLLPPLPMLLCRHSLLGNIAHDGDVTNPAAFHQRPGSRVEVQPALVLVAAAQQEGCPGQQVGPPAAPGLENLLQHYSFPLGPAQMLAAEQSLDLIAVLEPAVQEGI